MFSLIITLIATALAVALALAALYYGGAALPRSSDTTQAAKLMTQGQQLSGAAELFRADNGRWPHDLPELISQHYLTTVPLALADPAFSAGLPSALAAGTAWTMPLADTPTFVVNTGVTSSVCQTVNQDARGDNGILKQPSASYATQCYGASTDALTVVVTRDGASLSQLPGGSLPGAAPVTQGGNPAWLLPPGNTPITGGGNPPATAVFLATWVNFADDSAPTTYDFGSVGTGASSPAHFMLVNQDATAFTVNTNGIALTGAGFTLNASSCEGVLNPGDACDVYFAFAPTTTTTSTGALTATLSTGQVVSLALTGTGVLPARTQVTLSGSLTHATLSSVVVSGSHTVFGKGMNYLNLQSNRSNVSFSSVPSNTQTLGTFSTTVNPYCATGAPWDPCIGQTLADAFTLYVTMADYSSAVIALPASNNASGGTWCVTWTPGSQHGAAVSGACTP